jgi:two-component system LytT family response regulator
MTSAAIRALIVDDEPLARRGIRQLLAPHQDVVVVGDARNGVEAVHLLHSLAPDLVFLDVQMPELDGFAVLDRLEPDRRPFVIFVTAFDGFAVKAFDRAAVDYLVKPLHEERFNDAIGRVRERLKARAALRPAPRLVIAGAGGDLVLDLAEVNWIEADDYYAAVHALGRRHLVRESLASLETRLDRVRFVRVHRSAIVNLAQVREIRATGSGDSAVVLRDGTEIPLSRRRRESVVEAMRRFAG